MMINKNGGNLYFRGPNLKLKCWVFKSQNLSSADMGIIYDVSTNILASLGAVLKHQYSTLLLTSFKPTFSSYI